MSLFGRVSHLSLINGHEFSLSHVIYNPTYKTVVWDQSPSLLLGPSVYGRKGLWDSSRQQAIDVVLFFSKLTKHYGFSLTILRCGFLW